MPQEYLKRILDARIYDLAIETPLDEAPLISSRVGNRVLLKREDLQPVFSFKVRGAYNKLLHLTDEQKQGGVIAASAGNHAQGLALSAKLSTGVLRRLQVLIRIASASSSISLPLSRSGGISKVITLMR